eukprot:s282_g18.t1
MQAAELWTTQLCEKGAGKGLAFGVGQQRVEMDKAVQPSWYNRGPPARGPMELGLAVIFGLHSVCSICLTLLNKQLAEEIPFPLTIVLFQCLSSIPFTLLANARFNQIKTIRTSHLPGALLISVLFISCLASSLLGLKRVHVPMVVVGKNLGPFWTALLEALILKAPLNPRTLFSLLIGVLGSTLYAMGDANSDLEGLFWVGSNALLVAFTSVSEKYVVRNVDQAALGFSLYRNAVAIPLLWILMTVGMENFGGALEAFSKASSFCWSIINLTSARVSSPIAAVSLQN